MFSLDYHFRTGKGIDASYWWILIIKVTSTKAKSQTYFRDTITKHLETEEVVFRYVKGYQTNSEVVKEGRISFKDQTPERPGAGVILDGDNPGR